MLFVTTEAHQETASNKPRTTWALHTFKPVCRTIFETPWGKLQNLLWMELVTDIASLFFGNKFYLGLIWRNIVCHRKYQCKEKYISFFRHQNLGTHSGILVWKFHWLIHCLDNNRPIVWGTIDFLFSKTYGNKRKFLLLYPLSGKPWDLSQPKLML